jgi:hypothetical protein
MGRRKLYIFWARLFNKPQNASAHHQIILVPQQHNTRHRFKERETLKKQILKCQRGKEKVQGRGDINPPIRGNQKETSSGKREKTKNSVSWTTQFQKSPDACSSDTELLRKERIRLGMMNILVKSQSSSVGFGIQSIQ